MPITLFINMYLVVLKVKTTFLSLQKEPTSKETKLRMFLPFKDKSLTLKSKI